MSDDIKEEKCTEIIQGVEYDCSFKKKTQYEEKVKPYLDYIEHWRREGDTLQQIAHKLNVTESYLSKNILKHPELEKAILTTYRVQTELEKVLYKVACGYSVEEETLTTTIDSEGKKFLKKELKKKHIPPNVIALIFTLRNRAGGKWKNNPEDFNYNDKGKIKELIESLKISEEEIKED